MKKTELVLRIIGLGLSAAGIAISAIVELRKKRLSEQEQDAIADKVVNRMSSNNGNDNKVTA